MKAAIFKAYGEPDAISYGDVPTPELQDDQVLVKVAATTFNPADAMLRSGALQQMFEVAFPYVLGLDVAGVVERIGSGVTGFNVGDRVFATLSVVTGGGSGEYVAVNAADVALAPSSCPLGDAAALAAAGLTAWQGLFDHGNLQHGQRVLIAGAAGGVGTAAVQLAKARGAYVIGTASCGRVDMLLGIGADEVVDYSSDIADAVSEPVDLVFNLGPFTAPPDALLGVLKKGGTLVTATLPPNSEKARQAGVSVVPMAVQNNGGQLAEIAKLVDEGKIHPVVSEQMAAAQTAAAHARIGTTYGKVVLVVDGKLAELKG